MLNKHGALKDSVRESGAKIHVTITYGNSLAVWPPWPFSSPTALSYTYSAHLVTIDEEKTQVNELVSETEWTPRYNRESSTCGQDGRSPGNSTHPGPGCTDYVMEQIMNERHGLVITFGQQGKIGSTQNALTLLVASLSVIAVLNGKVSKMITAVAVKQLKYTGSVFMTRPASRDPIPTLQMMKQVGGRLSAPF